MGTRKPDQFYGSLAAWWPLISPVTDYAEEAAYVVKLLRSAPTPVRTVLELGSGGGHMAYHLNATFDVTLTDLSEDMLAVSRGLNPGCSHHHGDMRTLRLGRHFDAVFIHDAIDYMTTGNDLAAAFETASAHLIVGGLLVVMPDDTAETFEPGTDVSGSDGEDGRAARLFEWTWNPDPSDTSVRTEYAFVLREADGTVTTAHETHHHGLFGEATWLRLLTDAGFTAERLIEETTEDRTPRSIFVARKN